MSGVRKASKDDIPAILPLLRQFHSESVFHDVPPDETTVSKFLLGCLDRQDRACVLLYEFAASQVDGLLIGYCEHYWFSPQKGAWDLAVYVRPERRGSLIAYRLWSQFQSWAIEVGAHLLWMGTASGIAPQRSRKFYLGLGMQEVGSLYRMKLAPEATRS